MLSLQACYVNNQSHHTSSTSMHKKVSTLICWQKQYQMKTQGGKRQNKGDHQINFDYYTMLLGFFCGRSLRPMSQFEYARLNSSTCVSRFLIVQTGVGLPEQEVNNTVDSVFQASLINSSLGVRTGDRWSDLFKRQGQGKQIMQLRPGQPWLLSHNQNRAFWH